MSKDVITNSEKLRKITIERVEKFLSKDAWTDINLFSKLYKHRSQDAVKLQVYSVPDTDPNFTDKAKLEDVVGQTFVPANVGQAFGPSWSTHWFKGTQNKVDFLMDLYRKMYLNGPRPRLSL
jgi:alpha-mannosidase